MSRDALAPSLQRILAADEEVAHLAGSTGMSAGALRSFVTAHTLASQLAAGKPPIRLSPEVVFGLLAGGTAPSPAAFRTLREIDVRSRLGGAVGANQRK